MFLSINFFRRYLYLFCSYLWQLGVCGLQGSLNSILLQIAFWGIEYAFFFFFDSSACNCATSTFILMQAYSSKKHCKVLFKYSNINFLSGSFLCMVYWECSLTKFCDLAHNFRLRRKFFLILKSLALWWDLWILLPLVLCCSTLWTLSSWRLK